MASGPTAPSGAKGISVENINKISIFDCELPDFAPERAVIEASGAVLEICQCRTEDELITAFEKSDAICNQYAQFTSRVLESLGRCRGLVR